MYPFRDIVLILQETPFSRWKDEDKKDLLNCGRSVDLIELNIRKEVKKTGKSYNLHFKDSWFQQYPWLCSSVTLQKLFCWPCLLFSNKFGIWNTQGFCDFQNVTRAFNKHKDSEEHLKCQLQLKTFEKNRSTIADALRENTRLCILRFNECVSLNRQIFRLVVSAVLYLSVQELPFRSHDERVSSGNRGNFKELLKLLISEKPLEIQTQYQRIKTVFSGESKTVQNEMLDCISNYIQDHIKGELNNATFFSIQVDDSTDICVKSQCSVIVRYISNGEVTERFLGFYDVSEDRSAENLFNLLDGVLKGFKYEHKLVAQCYDGAAVMSGHLNDLQNRIKDKAPQAHFVHCMAHCLNLVLQQSCKKISQCRIFFASVNSIPPFFHNSAKRMHALETVSCRIPTVAEIRCSSSSRLLRVIIDEWSNLKTVFELLMNDEMCEENTIRSCKGFLNEFSDFEFTFLVFVFNDIFCLTDLLFEILQEKSVDIGYCATKIVSTCALLHNKRNEQHFLELFEESKQLTPITRRRRNSFLTDGDIAQTYCLLYYEIIDNILMEMDLRFKDCEKLQFLSLTDSTQFESFNKQFPVNFLINLEQCYPQIFNNIPRLRTELSLFYADDSFRSKNSEQILRDLYVNSDIFEESYKLFSLVLTIPSSTSVEHSFSCLKRLKTFSRGTVSQCQLSSLASISIHQELLSKLIKSQPFYEDIIDKYASLKDRETDLIYRNMNNIGQKLPAKHVVESKHLEDRHKDKESSSDTMLPMELQAVETHLTEVKQEPTEIEVGVSEFLGVKQEQMEFIPVDTLSEIKEESAELLSYDEVTRNE